MVEYKIIHNSQIWNESIGSFPNFSPYQIFEWSDYKKKMGWKTISLKAVHNKNTGFLQIAYKKKMNIFWGWIIGSIAGDVTLFDKNRLIHFIQQKFKIKYGYIRSNYVNELMGDESFSLYQSGWEKCQKKINSEFSMHGLIDKSLDEIKSSFSSNFKRNIKRGVSKNKDIIIVPLSEFNTEHIDKLFTAFKKIKDVSLPDRKELNVIQEKLGDRIIVAASYLKQEIAGLHAFLYYKNRAIDFWAATDTEGRKKYTSYIIFWKLLEKAKNMGIEDYDMAGIDPVKNPNVYKFKNGTRFKIVEKLGEWEISNHKILPFVFNRIYFK